ncbi:hypothetical protein V7124_07155 [Neobacillus niacini]|uniref:hypothetical protein n=1 Tax=Neobacillus niacini TaxID=86668 RepID=UPI002FFED9AC
MSETHRSTEGYQEPRTYEIRLQGQLDTRWADRFAGMTFNHESDGTTILTGQVVDQAALHGLLRKVRDLGLPLVSVIQIDHKQAKMPNVNAETTNSSKKEPNR